MKLNILTELPAGILELPANQLHHLLRGPTLFQLAGRRSAPLFISVLQHGNETSGWDALRQLLTEYGRTLPRSLWIYVANVEAARYGLRRLDHQPDFNRCWPGGEPTSSQVHRLLADLTDRVRGAKPFASIDLHNTSGRNPQYAATTRLDPDWLYLAAQFASRAVVFNVPKGIQSECFSRFCPAITVECGHVGAQNAIPVCRDFLRHCLELEAFPSNYRADLQLYRTVARLTLGPDVSFGIGEDCTADLCLDADLEALNFTDLQPGANLGRLRATDSPRPISALDDHGNDVTDHYLRLGNGQIQIGYPLTPAMLTLDPVIARQDCLGYLMQEVQLPHHRER